MTVTLELKPEIEGRIIEEAKARGLTVENYILYVLRERAANGEATFAEMATPEQWEAALDEFIRSAAFQDISWTVDDSRESIYREREDAQL
jgi:hypothetical protein